MAKLEYRLSYWRHLPHIQPSGATLFVTFRLDGSIPAAIQQQLIDEAERIEAILAQIPSPQERAKQAYLEKRRLFGKWDSTLDAASAGPVWLRNPEIARLVADSLHYLNGRVLELNSFCIMPNHVHTVFTPLPKDDDTYHSLSSIMHSAKRYSARQANKLLEREGQFWQHESYDHVVRDAAELERIVKYVLNNPVKVGLVNQWQEWPWTYCKWDVM
ncbi:MAG: transposase [Chloroflexota bacterium]